FLLSPYPDTEVNILWAAHQVHHSSEDYNLSTALRQSVTQQLSSWLFYLPMALAVPPSVFAVHIQFNLLYQFWIHTEFSYYVYLWERFWSSPSTTDKLSVIFKGPGWEPGKPRLGCHSDLPEVTGEEAPHNPEWPLALQVYVTLHFFLLLGVYDDIFAMKAMLSPAFLLLMTGYIMSTLTALGFIIEKRPGAAVLEMLRCVLFLLFHKSGYVRHLIPMLSVPTEQ
ncbi:hypothetical protein Z043_109006, partial [Scleropages formosus]